MRTHRPLYGVAAQTLAGLAACALSAGQAPNLKEDERKRPDAPATDAEEKTEEFEYFVAGEKKTATRQVLTLDLRKGVKMQFIRIKAGTFHMGSPDSDQDAKEVEKPRHEVEITKDFYLGKYPVTQVQYDAMQLLNRSYFSRTGDGKQPVSPGAHAPVEQVTWERQRVQERTARP